MPSWAYWFIVFLIILVVLWIFWGRKDYSFVGLNGIEQSVLDHSNVCYVDPSTLGLSYEDPKVKIVPEVKVDPGLKIDPNTTVNNVCIVNSSQKNLNNDITQKKRGRRMFKASQPTPYSKRNEFGSRGEYLCCKISEELFGKPFVQVRPDFLKNPETNRNLEIDCFNEELKLGIEYSGKQHYHYPNGFNDSLDKFIQQVRRDDYKREACDKQGVYLITVPFSVPELLYKKYIINYLPDEMKKLLKNSDKVEKLSPEELNKIVITMEKQT